MHTDEPFISEYKLCIKCDAALKLDSRYCNACGTKQVMTLGSEIDNWALLKQAAIFYSCYLLICCLSRFTDAFNEFSWSLIIEIVIALIPLVFFAFRWSDDKILLKWPNFSLQKLSLYCGCAMAAGFLVPYSVDWLNITIFSKEQNLFNFYGGSRFAAFILVFFTAVTPALFEELGFRGYLLQTLLRVVDKNQSIYVSSFLFAVMHLNFISLFWLIPFALFLGYVRVKENTLWYGIFIHFCFNLTACLFELL